MKFARPINLTLSSKYLAARPSALLVIAAALALCSLILTSCSSLASESVSTITPTSLPTFTSIPPSATPIPTATVLSPDAPFAAWVDSSLPNHIKNNILQTDFLEPANDHASAQLFISQEEGIEAVSWLYLAVAPFYSYLEDIQSADLRECWSSGPDETMPFSAIFVSENAREYFDLLWGPGHEECVETVSLDSLSEQLWLEQDAIGLIPFEHIQPSLKILKVDELDPLSKDFDQSEYSLVLRLRYQIPPGIFIDLSSFPLITNFDQSKLSSVALTGVTALVRDTANIMETEGVTYPAGDIQDLLLQSDITHISNEVPFAEDCPSPETYQVSLRFCSDDRYLELLEVVGTDIVELSGDHFGDWGPEAMLHTLDLYHQQGWLTYGGGENLAAGLSPVFIEHNGNQFAFIGCNGKGIDKYATATDENPGAAQCDFNWMTSEITRLSSDGFIVIATMQHEEVDNFGPIALQQYDFRKLAEAGAVIVSGSQSHHPQAIEYTGASFIHYGLGNLFFDQWFLAHYNPKSHINKDKAFIDLHYFYDNKYIATRLVPLQFIDNARPRPMTLEERVPFLDEIYRNSKWNGDWIYLYPSGYMQNRTEE